jgi:phage tail tube protein FII
MLRLSSIEDRDKINLNFTWKGEETKYLKQFWKTMNIEQLACPFFKCFTGKDTDKLEGK